jgi:hypothetical protein
MDLSLLIDLWILSGIITAAFAGLMIYRSIIGMKEADQLFLDAAEENLEAEQRAIVMRVERLDRYIKTPGVVSAFVLVTIAAIWICRGIVGFNSPITLQMPWTLSKIRG